MARVKTLSREGREFRLASLKLIQVEDLLEEEILTVDRQWAVVLDSLRNANESGWTRESLAQMLDVDDFIALYHAVLAVSGLKRREKLENANQEPLDFQFIRCHLVHTIGWTFEQADQCAFADVMSIFEHWADFPPQHVLMAGYVGYKSGQRKTTDSAAMAEMVSKTIGGAVHSSIDSLPLEMQGILAQGLGLFGETKPDEGENPTLPLPLS